MAEKLSNQMKDLSLESDKILGKSLETVLNFCLNVEFLCLESSFEQTVGLRFVYSKIYITLFFLSEKILSAPDAGKSVQLPRIVLIEKCTSLAGARTIKSTKKKQRFLILIIG